MKMEERDRLIREEGKNNGIKRYNELIIKLSEEGLLDLLPKAAKDPNLLDELYRKYDI